MRQPIRIAVEHAASCETCPFHALTIWGSKTTWVDCRRADCDNHLHGPLPQNGGQAYVPPVDNHKPPLPFAPE